MKIGGGVGWGLIVLRFCVRSVGGKVGNDLAEVTVERVMSKIQDLSIRRLQFINVEHRKGSLGQSKKTLVQQRSLYSSDPDTAQT